MTYSNTLILVAGWAHTANCLHPIAEELAAVLGGDFEIISTDVAALETESGDPISGLATLVESRGSRKSYLCGWSMGGMVALEAVLANKVLCHGLILLGGTLRFCGEAGENSAVVSAELLAAMRHQLRRDPKTALVGFFTACAAPHQIDEAELAAKVEQALGIGVELLCKQLGYLERLDLRSQLTAAQDVCRLLLIHGEQDCIVPAAASIALHNIVARHDLAPDSRLVPDSQIVVVEGMGHWPQREGGEIQRLVEIVSGFVSDA